MPFSQEQANVRAVTALFDAWRTGKAGYPAFVADDCVYESAGFPVLRGRAAILEFLFGGGMARVADRYANPRLQDIRRLDAEVLHLVAAGNVVFTERVDHHYDADGAEVLTTRLTGVMEFDEQARCTGWREYHDPAYFTGRPTPGWGPQQPTALAPR